MEECHLITEKGTIYGQDIATVFAAHQRDFPDYLIFSAALGLAGLREQIVHAVFLVQCKESKEQSMVTRELLALAVRCM